MRLKSLTAAIALGTGLALTGLAAAEATTPPEPASSPGHLSPSHPGDNLPTAGPPGKAIPKMPNYTG
ncbi:unnamed protein product [[Actinomadura] parvosata subsp. kistnae]|uniref:Uncharacterized protein n=1 Tax=[Actinomadura] parvosata subsp. kistnae TaxID=1909395 RepID=A0A1U9ZWC5_9ACTN|nr:hypothetical protein [Nonomuraea sp. ATCC 55076]AQZ62266.1 hypothetical protein BKM31_13055 [Nonomuraea sp. ATCC 55076]SPL99738.1 unnamed protein product [Actinomadura parvosata subsp. kistnae]